jgi:TatD DNase family protein
VGAKERQEKAFRIQLSLAKELGKPVMVHARPRKGTQDVYDDVARILRECPGVVANIHFFVGDIETVSELGKCGVTFSYGGVVTFARDYDEAVRSIPSGSILTETDCPYAAPASRRGKRNDPLSIPEILKALSEVRCVEEDVLRQEVREAARRVFAIEAST